MKINLFSGLSLQKNDYRGKSKNKNVSFGAPPKFEKMKLDDDDYIKLPKRTLEEIEAIKKQIIAKQEREEAYRKEFMKQVNAASDKLYNELVESEKAIAHYDVGFVDHRLD